MSYRLDTIEHAVAEIAAGRAVVVVDDEDRENEGDLVFAAAKSTPELMAFTVRYSSGVICVPLPGDMLEMIATPQELRRIADDPLRGKVLFAAKEAVYKAVYPLDRVFLEFRDIEVDLAGRRAMTRTGRVVALRFRLSSHVVVLALPQIDQAYSRQLDQSTPMRKVW